MQSVAMKCDHKMEGCGDGFDGSRGDGVQESGKESIVFRSNLRIRKSRSAVQVLPEKQSSSPVHVVNEDGMDGNEELQEWNNDGLEGRKAGDARWRRYSGAGPRIPDDRGSSEVHDSTGGGIAEGSRTGIGGGVQVTGMSGWPNYRARRHARVRLDTRSQQALAASSDGQIDERALPGHFAELFDHQARGSEASGSGVGEAPIPSSAVGISSDEESRQGLGKEPFHDFIDLVNDSPPFASAGHGETALFHREGTLNGEAEPSQNSSGLPSRRFMQRPALGSVKRARHLRHRGGRGYPEGSADQGGDSLLSDDNQESMLMFGEQRSDGVSFAEPYNLRSSRSINVGGSTVNSGLPTATEGRMGRRLGRRRFLQPGSGFSEISILGRPSAVASGRGDVSADVQLRLPLDLDDSEDPTVVSVTPGNTIVLDDDPESDRARQLAEDERVARELQQSFASEALGGEQAPTDEMLARMLQDEENSHGRGLPLGRRPMFLVPSGMQAFLGDAENHRGTRRLLQNQLAQPQAEVSGNAASSSRAIRRSGYGRSSAFSRMLSTQSLATSNAMDDRRVQFPSTMGLESRLEFLAALEMAFQEQLPVGLQLAHVDRDFNENDYEMLLALDTDNDRHRGASRESIEQLPLLTLKATDIWEEDCSICLEVPVAGDVTRRLPCMHGFHQQCIDKWLACQAVCPVCKAHITEGS